MDPQIVKNHALVSHTAVRFLDYAVARENCLDRLELLDKSQPGLAGHYQFPLQSWPWFIVDETRQMLAASACRVPALIYRAVRAEFAGDARRFAAFFNLPPILGDIFVQSGMNLDQLIVRVDAMLTGRGLKIMEINSGANVGGWQIQWLSQQYRNHPALAPFFDTVAARPGTNIPLEYLSHMVRQGRACLGRAGVPVNVLFVVEEMNGMEMLEQPLKDMFRAALAALGETGELLFERDFTRLRFDAGCAVLNGQRIAALASYRSNHGDLSPEELAQANRSNEPPLELYRCFLSGKIAWPGNPFSVVIGDKRSLAIVNAHKDSGLFTEEERSLIERHVPWSAPVAPGTVVYDGAEADLKMLLLARQRDFVVKIARGSAGQDVFVGRFQSAADWQAAVGRAFADGVWLAQEYCESLPFYGQAGERGYAVHDVVWGVFGFGGHYGGTWLRLMQKDNGDGVINSAKGAMETIVYEIDE